MSSRKLYRTPIPGSSLRQSDDMTRPEVATLAGVSSLPAVEKTGSQADEITLAGAYRGRYADRLGTELRELLDADALDAVPFYGVNDSPPDEADVTADRAEGGRVAPVSDAAAQFRGRLVKTGTRATHRRAVHAAVLVDVSDPAAPRQVAVHETDYPIHNCFLHDEDRSLPSYSVHVEDGKVVLSR